MYRTPLGLETEQENKLCTDNSFSGEKINLAEKAWDKEQYQKRLPLEEIQNVRQTPTSKDTLFHPVETKVCLVKAKMDADSIRSVFSN